MGTARYSSTRVECVTLYEQDTVASFDEIRAVIECFAEAGPEFNRPSVRAKFRFGSFSVSCRGYKGAMLALADRFKKPMNYNCGGFRLPSKRGGYSKANATRIDEHLPDFEL